MIVYKKFIKIPLGTCKIGIKRLNKIRAKPEYIKSVTKGETKLVAITPTGQNVPNIFNETGAVNI